MRKILPCIVIAYLLSSCAYTNYLYIDVKRPASGVTFPNNVRNITLINNAVETSTDSSEYVLIEALAQFIGESDAFTQVDVLENFQSHKLSKEEIKAVCEANNSDAAILLNFYELLPEKTSTEYKIDGMDLFADTLKISARTNFQIFLSEDESFSGIVNVTDSLFWDEVRTKETLLSDSIPSENEILQETAIQMADKAEKAFTPYWEQQERWYYVNGTTLMKEASMYAKNNDWQKAKENWHTLFETEKKNSSKAKLASNIALAYEMTDDIEAAYKWIKDAEILLSDDANSSKNENLEQIRLYKSELEKRLQDFNLLDLQEN